jgi:nucleoside-diphosphate-sugar epimerase
MGTSHVLAASLEAGVRRVVYTSTMDVFAAPRGGTLVETNVDQELKPTAYERSKQAAEREAKAFEQRGLDIVYLNPGAVYGPTPSPTTAALNGFLMRLVRGQVPLVPPGGMPLAFIDGVVQAHLAAADVGRTSERYLLADGRLSMHQVAELALAGTGRSTPKTAPAWLLQFLASVSAPLARVFGFKPLIAASELSLLLWNVDIDSSKAQRELGYRPTPPKEGIQKTVEALTSWP